MNSGKTLFSQLMDCLPWSTFTRIVARRTGPALEAMYRFLLWLIPTIDKFPRSQKFVLGDRIEAYRSRAAMTLPILHDRVWP
jgi:hypothetical protein